ncbi:MAG: MlaD family protein [Desulfobulbus sp.]|uniref:MlaD family protein n=1 Tax=Desulfobulbus sp. TaxID=895 RepID=UPI00284B4FBA|nr:MlaD family protein [Desulfobulbus sp.]MDR2550901.1 MlaD family protein [Desulfobulbus sp.]
MSKKANPTLVGGFVLVALALALAAVVVLGKIKFKDNRLRCVAYFTGSLYGLDAGAPVTFRGVTIGRVAAVQIDFDSRHNNYVIPVYLDIEQKSDLTGKHQTNWGPEELRAMLRQMIGQGLRAQLKITSLLTSKLYIDLAFFPEAQAPQSAKEEGLFEIPTQPSGLEQITQKLEKLPLDEILNKTAAALDGISSIVNSKETRNMLASLDSTMDRVNGLLARANAEFPALAAELKKGLANFSTLSATATTFLRTADKEVPEASAELKHLLSGLNATAGALTKTLNNIQQLTEKDSLFAYQVTASLREIERTAVSVRQLTDYLQQHPDALIFGQREDKP